MTKVDLSKTDTSKYGYALLDAIMQEENNVAEHLIQANAHLDWITDEDGNGPLHHAVLRNNPSIILQLLKHGADKTAKNKDGETPFEMATRIKCSSCLDALTVNTEMRFSLLSAVKNNDTDSVRQLLQSDMSAVNLATIDKNSLLHHAVIRNYPYMIALLLQNGADISLENNDGMTAIELAAENKLWDCVSAFALIKSDENNKGHYGFALLKAVTANNLGLVNQLLTANASTECKTWNKKSSPLHVAIVNRNIEIIRLLLKSGANVNSLNEENNTPLHYAVSRNLVAIVSLLIANGANVELQNNENKTPIQIASDNKFWDCVDAFAVNRKTILDKSPTLWKKPAATVAAPTATVENTSTSPQKSS